MPVIRSNVFSCLRNKIGVQVGFTASADSRAVIRSNVFVYRRNKIGVQVVFIASADSRAVIRSNVFVYRRNKIGIQVGFIASSDSRAVSRSNVFVTGVHYGANRYRCSETRPEICVQRRVRVLGDTGIDVVVVDAVTTKALCYVMSLFLALGVSMR